MNSTSVRTFGLVISGVLVAVAFTTLLVYQANLRARLRAQDAEAGQQGEQLARLVAENERLSNLVARAAATAPPDAGPPRELLRLRGEVGVLRQQTNDLGSLRQENLRLSQALADSDTNRISPEDQLLVRQNHAVDAMTTLLQALKNYAATHSGQYPGALDQLITSGELGATNFPGNLGLNDFQFGQAAGTDPQGNPAILKLLLRSPKPGGGTLMILGGLTADGVPRTSVWNLRP